VGVTVATYFLSGLWFRFRPASLPVFCCWFHLPLDLWLCCCLFSWWCSLAV